MNYHPIKLSISFVLIVSFIQTIGKDVTSLAERGKANYVIVSPANASECEKFAARELKRFLFEMSKANFEISDKIPQKSIVVSAVGSLPESAESMKLPILSGEAYAIFKQRETIYLVGGNQRATLFAVYDFLNQLGCQWVAPDYEFFGSSNRMIPSSPSLELVYNGDKNEIPNFKYRKLYVEEGRTHNIQNLKQLVDWMPKMRYNTLVIPINYEGNGKVKWDNWREELAPELQKRGIIIEVGGHGYQNFMNASMDGGRLYKEHPEWFGLDKEGKRSGNTRMVICTSNPDAVSCMYKNILTYLKSHPEINIFDFWPPDSEFWCQCEACTTMGSETDRHVILVNKIAMLLQKEIPNIVLECLAYSRYIAPTQIVTLNDKVLLDFCPINQCFEYQIYEGGAASNEVYNNELVKWTKSFSGDISIYSYFRKYAWRSLPNIIPYYMQHELNYYHSIGAKGISVYSEPGDWFTFGLNHFVLSYLAWNPNADVETLIKAYSNQIYRQAAPVAVFVYNELEDIVRFACNLPFTTMKKPEQYGDYSARITNCRQKVKTAIDENNGNPFIHRNLIRLDLMLEYANKSIGVMRSKSFGNKEATASLEADVKSFLRENADEGVFIP
jgi:hypothetical protein